MSYTNQTKNLQLPQYVASDHPTWLQDINGAFEKVDNFAGQVEQNQLTTNQKFQANENRWSDNDAKLEEIQEVATQQGVEITANAEDIAKLQENVNKLNTDTTQQSDDIDTLKNNVQTNTTDITELEGKVDLNTQNINDLMAGGGTEEIRSTLSRRLVMQPNTPIEVHQLPILNTDFDSNGKVAFRVYNDGYISNADASYTLEFYPKTFCDVRFSYNGTVKSPGVSVRGLLKFTVTSGQIAVNLNTLSDILPFTPTIATTVTPSTDYRGSGLIWFQSDTGMVASELRVTGVAIAQHYTVGITKDE